MTPSACAHSSSSQIHFRCACARLIRNPLHAVAGCAQFLLESTGTESASFEDVATIVSSTAQMSRLIADIMDWSKVSAGKAKLVLARTDVHQLLKSAVKHCVWLGLFRFCRCTVTINGATLGHLLHIGVGCADSVLPYSSLRMRRD